MGGCKGIKNRTLGVLDSNRDNHWHGLLQIYCAYAPDVDTLIHPSVVFELYKPASARAKGEI